MSDPVEDIAKALKARDRQVSTVPNVTDALLQIAEALRRIAEAIEERDD